MPKPPPSTDALLEQVGRVTDEAWLRPFLDDPGGAIAPFRGFARAGSLVAETGSRAASRQYFVAPPGFESAGFGERARGVVTIRRTQALDQPLLASTGSMTFVGIVNSAHAEATTDDVDAARPGPPSHRSGVVAAVLRRPRRSDRTV